MDWWSPDLVSLRFGLYQKSLSSLENLPRNKSIRRFGITINTFVQKAIPPMALNIFWAFIAIFGFVKALSKARVVDEEKKK
ncbi:MAG: hypothetical protein WD231_05930 [Candidatus Woykebacteria bacterium]